MKKLIKYYKSLTIGKRTWLFFLLYIFSGVLFGLLAVLNTKLHILYKFGIIVSSIFGLIFFFNLILLFFYYLKKIYKSKYRLQALTSASVIGVLLIYQYNFSDEAKENKMREKAERIVKSKLDSLHYMNTNYMSSNNHFEYCDIEGSKFNANHDIEVYFDCLYDKGYYLVNGVTFDLMSSYVQDKKK